MAADAAAANVRALQSRVNAAREELRGARHTLNLALKAKEAALAALRDAQTPEEHRFMPQRSMPRSNMSAVRRNGKPQLPNKETLAQTGFAAGEMGILPASAAALAGAALALLASRRKTDSGQK